MQLFPQAGIELTDASSEPFTGAASPCGLVTWSYQTLEFGAIHAGSNENLREIKTKHAVTMPTRLDTFPLGARSCHFVRK